MNRHLRAEIHDAVPFVLLTYTISWGAWGLLLLYVGVEGAVRTVLFTIGLWGPFLSALALGIRRTRSVRVTVRSIVRLRARLRWYAIAFFLPIVLYGAVAFVYLSAGGTPPAETSPAWLYYPLMLGVSLFVAGGQEEPGWRGFLHPPLQERHGALRAALLVGVVWAVWHTPLFLLPGTPLSRVPLEILLPAILVFGVLLTFVLNAGGAVGPVAIMHAQVNALAPWVPVPPGPLWLGLLIASALVAALILVIYGPARLAPDETERLQPTVG